MPITIGELPAEFSFLIQKRRMCSTIARARAFKANCSQDAGEYTVVGNADKWP